MANSAETTALIGLREEARRADFPNEQTQNNARNLVDSLNNALQIIKAKSTNTGADLAAIAAKESELARANSTLAAATSARNVTKAAYDAAVAKVDASAARDQGVVTSAQAAGTAPTALPPAVSAPTDTLSQQQQLLLEQSSGLTDQDLQLAEQTDVFNTTGKTQQQLLLDEQEAAFNEPVVVTATDSDITYSPEPNPLLAYSSYTYSIGLHALSVDDYNTMTTTGEYTPTNVLIAGAGRYGASYARNPNFNHDFYFDRLNMASVIGANSRSRMSNVVDVNFTIVEPNGVTLLNRIILASANVNAANYLEMPYVLQIDFYGYDDGGNIVGGPIPNMTKFIPIKLATFKIKMSTKGAEYAIQAVPFSHEGFNESVATTPVNLSVVATTIHDFFADKTVDVAAAAQADREGAIEQERQIDARTDISEEERTKLKKSGQATIAQTSYGTSSYTGAVNSWLRSVHKEYDQIRVIVDPKIGVHNIVIAEKTDPKLVKMADPTITAEVIAQHKGNTGASSGGPDFLTNVFSVNAGTNIITVIENAIKNSDYIRNQLTTDAEKEAAKSGNTDALLAEKKKPFDWYKVVPHITLGKYDPTRNVYSKTITYYVTHFLYYNDRYPLAAKSKPAGVSKEYNYMFTGKNDDIIDFNIDFDCLYYTAITFNPAKAEATNLAKSADTSSQNPPPSTSQPTSSGQVDRQKIVAVAGQAALTASGGQVDAKTVAVGDMLKTILSDARGDMINVQMRINGDPHFIKQDDLFYSPAISGYAPTANGYTKNGSLATDVSEIFARVTFNTPADFSDTTGMMNFEEQYSSSVFSGIYRIIKVDSTFQSGKFEQTIDMIRLYDQPINDAMAIGQKKEQVPDPNGRPTTAIAAIAPPAVIPAATTTVEGPTDTPPGATPDEVRTASLSEEERQQLINSDLDARRVAISQIAQQNNVQVEVSTVTLSNLI